jgi:hypothetical protein
MCTFVSCRRPLFAALCVGLFWIAACGQTGIRPVSRTGDLNLSRPARILVYDFAVSETEVTEAHGILRQQPTIKDPLERERVIGRQVAEVLAVELVEGLRGLGFKVERGGDTTLPTDEDLLIDGQFVNVDEGDRLRRLVIGFGSGGSRVDTRIQLYRGQERAKLMEFTTHSNSSKLPGAAATAGAGAVIAGGLTAGTALGTAVVSGVKAYRSDVERMAAASAEEAVRYLSEFFVKQRWIRPDQVKKARIAY